VETLQSRLQYPVVAAHPTLPKPTKPFILGYSVIAIMLHFSAQGKAYLSVCPVALLAYLLFLKLCCWLYWVVVFLRGVVVATRAQVNASD